MTKNPIKLQDEIQRLKTNIRKIKKSVKALRADRQALVNAAKEAKAHLDNRDDADAWTVLDKALKIQEPKKYPEVGDKIAFRLDNKWEGKGKVVPFNIILPKKAFNVKLDEPCKEFDTGEEIIVWLEEITACHA